MSKEKLLTPREFCNLVNIKTFRQYVREGKIKVIYPLDCSWGEGWKKLLRPWEP